MDNIKITFTKEKILGGISYMKNKKILFLLIFVLIVILIFLFFIVKNFNNKNISVENTTYSEYTPEEEISSDQMRETIVTLYFIDSNNNLKSEGKLIDSVTLLQNPYKTLIELLLTGPQTETLNKVFPDNTQILDATLENNCVTLNFSEGLLNYSDDNQKYNIINSILNTLTQLNEVNSIKILINGSTPEMFNEEYFLSH